MDIPEPKNSANTISWISSLAITVTCCAIQFVVFAGFIFDLKESISILRVRSDLANERLKEISAELDNDHRHATVQQIQILPPPDGSAVQLPVSLTPPATQPAMAPVGTAMMQPVGTTTMSPVEAPKVTPEQPPAKP